MQGESIKVGKIWIRVVNKIPFKKWVESQYKDWDAFLRLNKKDRELIFLKWKWGFENETTINSLEDSERYILFINKDANNPALDDGWRFYMEKKRAFDSACEQVKREIGLIEKAEPAGVLF